MVQSFTFSANHDKAFFLVVGRHQFIFQALPKDLGLLHWHCQFRHILILLASLLGHELAQRVMNHLKNFLGKVISLASNHYIFSGLHF